MIEELENLAVYSEEEMNLIRIHMEKNFGKIDSVLHKDVSSDYPIEIAVIKPTEERNYYTLVTIGIGAYMMSKCKSNPQKDILCAEILICLPPDWNINSEKEEDSWPVSWLKRGASLAVTEKIGWGYCISNKKPIAKHTKLSNILLQHPYSFGEESFSGMLPDGNAIHFYQMIPLYDEEVACKVENGIKGLENRMGMHFSHVVDMNRKNYCSIQAKEWALAKEQIKLLYEGEEGPQGCLATDRILIDGCKVGYMYRERPDKGSDVPDSGWRFTAGDEDDDYMDNPENSGIYALNTICNYDPEIIPFLELPFGSAFYRNTNGIFQSDNE